MKFPKSLQILLSISLLLTGCVTPFEPEGHETTDNLIVIEGDINATGTTEVYVSRSQKLSDLSKRTLIAGASVWIQSESGTRFYANQQVSGNDVFYRTNNLNLNRNLKYKLCVSLPGGRQYESDPVPILVAPPIKEIGFTRDTIKESITFHVSAEDPTHNSRYYKWSFTADWEFSSHIFTSYIYNPITQTIDELPYDKNIYFCWNKGVSTSILVASTTHLTEDKVERMPLVSMGKRDERISIVYSMELTQRAITAEAYRYWDNLRKNSDKVGGIFSPQPSEMQGNIKCISDPGEIVLGYISAGVTSSKRFFATDSEMKMYRNIHDCALVEPLMHAATAWHSLYQSGYMIADYDLGLVKTYWTLANCVDCRTRGTKNKPAFWPNDHK